ncbi:uncharacterized protein LOC131638271 [Vicia villosa]|uniref:uncharacterized protein LOC131638271 n=1 Tax=Vicia villosa TaxID=3911 RepID=UPI00273B5D24|nr:uncharacterized protein LOC131638271 [Vicia villosa]
MSMKIISYNIRGLGGAAKKKQIQNLIRNHNPSFMCIQETKIESIEKRLRCMLWGSNDFGFASNPSVGRSGEILTIWDKREVDVQRIQNFEHMVWVEGECRTNSKKIHIVNIYAPCKGRRKRELWNSLSSKVIEKNGECICVLGDFNAIRNEEERRGSTEHLRREEENDFDNFITGADLIYLPLCGRKFTWSRTGGTAMSRIDRFLILEEWCRSWPTCSQWALDKELSDHRPILLCDATQKWGPKPFAC